MCKCPKCNGTGVVEFVHIENGKCFLCSGTGEITTQQAKRIELENEKAIQNQETNRENEEQRKIRERQELRIKLEGEKKVGYMVTIEKEDGQIIEKNFSEKQLKNYQQNIDDEIIECKILKTVKLS